MAKVRSREDLLYEINMVKECLIRDLQTMKDPVFINDIEFFRWRADAYAEDLKALEEEFDHLEELSKQIT